MTFGEYIKTLKSTRLYEKSEVKVVRRLFKEAGSYIVNIDNDDQLPNSTVYSWLSGERNCDTAMWFPKDSLNYDGLFSYLKSQGMGSQEKIQYAFKIYKTTDSTNANFLIDLETNDSDKFFWSLTNQFFRLLRLPILRRKDDQLVPPVTVATKNELSPGELRHIFLQLAAEYKFMDIFKRDPPTINRYDLADLKNFRNEIELLLASCHENSNILYIHIDTFYSKLLYFIESTEGKLNNRYGKDNDEASLNMDEDDDDDDNEDYDDDDDNEDYDDEDDDYYEEIKKYINVTPSGIPIADKKLFRFTDDPLALMEILHTNWRTFRNQMNSLYNLISSWQDET